MSKKAKTAMRELSADIWRLHSEGLVVAVTTSGLVGRDGRARVGRGAARQAAERFPWFAERLGAILLESGTHVALVGERIVAFPVENTPYESPSLSLIAQSASEIVALADRLGFPAIAVPRPGCGGGGLSWVEVRPLVAPLFDDRFVVVSLPP